MKRPSNWQTEMSLVSLIWAIVSVSVGGLGVMIGLMAVMKQALFFDIGLLIFFSLCGFLLLAAAESVLIWQLLRSRTGAKEIGALPQPQGISTKELRGGEAGMLPEPSFTVTDQTTRTLEPVLRSGKDE